MLKQQDMTETARVVFNELSVTEPATVGEIAQNTYLSRERCQLILTQLVMAGLADYQFGCYRRLQSKAFLFVVNGRLVGVRGTHQPSAHASGSQANLRPTALRKSRMSLSETGLMIHA